jgi:hypothetical protein
MLSGQSIVVARAQPVGHLMEILCFALVVTVNWNTKLVQEISLRFSLLYTVSIIHSYLESISCVDGYSGSISIWGWNIYQMEAY